jgi:hypothetical protein
MENSNMIAEQIDSHFFLSETNDENDDYDITVDDYDINEEDNYDDGIARSSSDEFDEDAFDDDSDDLDSETVHSNMDDIADSLQESKDYDELDD